MAIACIICSHQSDLSAYSFNLPAIIVNFPFASTCYTNGPFLYVVFLILSLICIWCFFVVFSIYVMFLLHVFMFSICSCHVVLKVYLLTYLLTYLCQQVNSAVVSYCAHCCSRLRNRTKPSADLKSLSEYNSLFK